jgi:hypothetical protein
MKEVLHKHRAAILTSLIATTIFLYFLEPILSWLGRQFLWVAAKISNLYVDRIFAEASHLETQDFAYFLLAAVLLFIAGVLLSLMRRLVRGVPAENASGNEEDVEDERHVRPSTGLAIAFKTTFFTFAVAMLLWVGAVLIANHVELSLISSFRQHIRILSPYLSTQEEEEIISDWSLMNSKADYDKLYSKLSQVAEENGLELPTNRIYAFSGF